MDWRKSSHSVENGNCVEVASAGNVLVRDTQDRAGAMLSIPAWAWCEFSAQLRGLSQIRCPGTPRRLRQRPVIANLQQGLEPSSNLPDPRPGHVQI